MRRNRDAELELLLAAERIGPFPPAEPHGPWVAGALARLDAHGPNLTRRALNELLREVREELEDVGGWSALAWQQHPDAELRDVLREVCALAASAHNLLEGRRP